MSSGLPDVMDAAWRQNALACLRLLVPATLLCSLFCGRLGVERGRALAGGILPGLLVFGAGMFAAGWIVGLTPGTRADAGAGGWLLLAVFAVLRADPPVPMRAGVGWTLAAGIFGALGIYGRMDALGSVGCLGLYVWWSAGWRRALGFFLPVIVAVGKGAAMPAMDGVTALTAFLFVAAAWLGFATRRFWMSPRVTLAAEPEATGRVPMASARRIIGGLVFVAWMGLPAMLGGFLRHEGRAGPWANVLFPFGMAVGLGLTDGLARWRKIS